MQAPARSALGTSSRTSVFSSGGSKLLKSKGREGFLLISESLGRSTSPHAQLGKYLWLG